MHSSKAMLANTQSYKSTLFADVIIQLALLKGERHEVYKIKQVIFPVAW